MQEHRPAAGNTQAGGDYLWLALHRDQWGIHPFVFRAGKDIDKKAIARRLSLAYRDGNGEGLVTLCLGPVNAVQDFSAAQTELERELQRRYRGGS